MSKNAQIAKEVMEAAEEHGFTITRASGCVVSIAKSFTPGDKDAFVECDSTFWDVLGRIPTSAPGSVWGTDGASIGGAYAVNHGAFKMNKSGCNKLVVKQLAKLI